MREMKDSGVEWIGEIPKAWETYRVKVLAKSLFKGNGITKDEVFADGDIQCIRYGEIYSKYDRNVKITQSRTKLNVISQPRYIEKGDIIFAGTGELIEEIGKNIVYIGEDECLVGGDIVVLRHNQNAVFLNYALNSVCSQAQKSRDKVKLKVVHISASDIGNVMLALPSIETQERIADYLDIKCTKIDSIIEKQQAIIEKLKEYKLSVITEAVTKGLNPDVEMKDSGVEWIGDVPEDWSIASLGSVSLNMRNGYVGPTRDIFQDDGVPYIQSLHVKDGLISFEKEKYFVSEEWGLKHPKVHEGQLLIVQTGDIGQVGLVTKEMDGYNCHALIIVTVNENFICPKYLMYYLRSRVGKELMLDTRTGALLPHLNSGKIKSTPVVYPNLQCQLQIIDYLDKKCKQIETMIIKKEKVLVRLSEYKKSLIYEVVTGKKEV